MLPSWLRRKILFFESSSVDEELHQSRVALQRHLTREDELRRRIRALENWEAGQAHSDYFVQHNRRRSDVS